MSNNNACEWQPIETAPKDGTEVLLLVKRRAGIPWCQVVGHFMPGGHCIEDHPPIARGWYFWNGSMFDSATEPTHWLALPANPDGYEKFRFTPASPDSAPPSRPA